MKVYDKLVRDRIPEIIESIRQKVIKRLLSQEQKVISRL